MSIDPRNNPTKGVRIVPGHAVTLPNEALFSIFEKEEDKRRILILVQKVSMFFGINFFPLLS